MTPQVEQLEERLACHGAPEQPNFLIVVTDDQRWDTLAGMPVVSGILQAQGITYSNAFATTPVCCPSRFSILTGQQASRHGVFTNHPDRHGGYKASRDHENETLAVWLAEAGYRTGLFGKYLNGYNGERVPPGWEEWLARSGGGHGWHRFEVANERGQQWNVNQDNGIFFAERVLDFIEQGEAQDDRPWLAYYAPKAPHNPAHWPDRFDGAFADRPPHAPPSYAEEDLSDKPGHVRRAARAIDLSGMQRSIRHQLRSLLTIDEQVGRFLDALEAQDEAQETVIIFTSDNGLLWGEHGLTRKAFPYEESARIPLVFWEGWERLGFTDHTLARNTDLAPTIAAYAGIAKPATVQGRDLNGEKPPSAILLEGWPQGNLTEGYKAVREIDRIFIAYSGGEEELYLLASDPYQLDNLAGNPAYIEELTRLRALLAQSCALAENSA